MDDETNREYSRAPKVEDLIKLCQALNQYGVKYLLIGGFAVILHGFIRGTKDIDLLVDPSVENIKKIKKALSFLPDNSISLIENDEVQKHSVVRIADEIIIDLMAKACGINFIEASQSIEYYLIEDTQIPVASKGLLIKMKDTVRPSDKMDIQYLKLRIEAESI